MPSLDSILTPWVKQPAGLFSTTHFALISFPTFFHEDMDEEERRTALEGTQTMACWIASGKKLNAELRNLFIEASAAWGEGLYSKEEAKEFIHHASTMGITGAQIWMDKLNNLPTLAHHLKKPLLYYAMTIAGCDGLQPE
eukprot:93614_1